MGTANLAFKTLFGNGIRGHVGRVVLAHVVLQSLAVGLYRRLPS